jgi:cobalt/nickel transport system permease protein
VAAAVLFVVAVALTPRQAVGAHVAQAAVVLAVARLGRVPLALLSRRLVVELPFVAFALALPFVAGGDRVQVLGVSVSEPGLWAAWSVLAKGTLGLAATALLVAIAAFLLRYVEVVSDELRRLQVARASRGQDPRWRAQVGAVARTAGALFVRTYERGERVHLAMRSRGYDGTRPLLVGAPAAPAEWARSLVAPAVAAAACALAWVAA